MSPALGFAQSLPDEMFHGGRLGGLRSVLRFELAPDGVDPPPELLGQHQGDLLACSTRKLRVGVPIRP